MHELLQNEEDYQDYLKALETPPLKTIRCNTLKISPEALKQRLEKKGWIVKQLFKEYPEYFVIESNLQPGELGRSLEHQLGYYYVQETCSMLPLFALQPQQYEHLLDLCAAPGSKTTQAAAIMQNTGFILANEKNIGRMKVLSANLQRCGASNVIITQQDGRDICENLDKIKIQFDKILIDAPCSGEGTFRSVPRSCMMWNINTVKKLNKMQKRLIQSALKLLKPNGEILYSTCTHTPEENEAVVNSILEEFQIEIIPITTLPKNFKVRQGITKWKDQNFKEELKDVIRIYPQDNNTEGFFLAKLRWKE
jgi:NOL1/NOP2/sun family putative RNA methylase